MMPQAAGKLLLEIGRWIIKYSVSVQKLVQQ
jgi:hypothetical protein